MMFTQKQIADAKAKVLRRAEQAPYWEKPVHEHDDCIRMAYEWLDAQTKTRTPARRYHPIKRLVEQWCGRYISIYDVEAAALLHPEIVEGEYPFYNISERFLLPNKERLSGIGEAFKHHYRLDQTDYWRHEDGRDIIDAVKRDLLVEAVFDYVGERCLEYVEGCRCCEAWNQYDLASAYGATRTR